MVAIQPILFTPEPFSPLPYGIFTAIPRLWIAEIEKHVAKTLSKLALTIATITESGTPEAFTFFSSAS